MNQSLQLLYDEHQVIVNAIEVGRQSGSFLKSDPEKYERIIRKLLYFFRTYADQFHHHKEEIILFPEMNRKNELLADGVVKEMFDNHEEFRELTGEVEKFLNVGNYTAAHQLLEKYFEALLDHIAVENEEVFQMAGSLFTEAELENISFRFEDCDRELEISKKTELADLISQLRNELNNKG